MSKPSEALVYVNEDASVRELTESEKKYVDTEFLPFDGARPYIKSHDQQRNGWGALQGFLPRDGVPDEVPIAPPATGAPQENAPRGVAESLLELIRKSPPNDHH